MQSKTSLAFIKSIRVLTLMLLYYIRGVYVVSKRKYKRLSYLDRLKIEELIKNNTSRKEIAKQIGVHQTTIDRELKRGGYPNYSADNSQKNIMGF